jgi:hypothetical protein
MSQGCFSFLPVDSLRLSRAASIAILPSALTWLMQDAVVAASVSQIQANRKLLRFENLICIFY